MDRYDIDSGPGGDASLGKDPDGPYVLHSDHVAEVERLRALLREADAMWDLVPWRVDDMPMETARRFGAIRRDIRREVG